ncbi:MAG: hypothetical protein ICV60_13650 [Pyrinomonadaceae bacterium]|nr:hypothetical protein [Pyrinomonadaceae bacterium]
MSGWQLQTRQFLLPKSGHQLSECEDAVGINALKSRFAVADGATEAFDARSWARLLAHSWVEIEAPVLTPEGFRAWIEAQGQSLHDSWNGLKLSWYAEEKARAGSFAAFVGLQLDFKAGASSWKAIALGDSCLIHRRNKSVLGALPIADYQGFNAAPLLVPSRASMQEAVWQQVIVGQGTIEAGDVLLLLSDAVAAWYLMLLERDEKALARFDNLIRDEREAELATLFESERVAGRIKDDDIAVVRVEIMGL